MARRPRPIRRLAGFTLVELLLVLVLLMLIGGAMVLQVATGGAGTALDQGVSRLDSAMSFARAHAANTGRKVQIAFEPDAATGAVAYRVVFKIESDPVAAPGRFEPMTNARWIDDGLNDLVIVIDAMPLGVIETRTALDGVITGLGLDESQLADELAMPTILFYPDGSTDSAQITLMAREGDDRRHAIVRLIGLTGAITHRFVDGSTETSDPQPLRDPLGPSLEINSDRQIENAAP